MAKENVPALPVTTPAPAPAPVASPAQVAIPAAASAAPAAAPGRDPKGRFTKPVAPPSAARSTISASKALGLDETPGKSAQDVIARERKRFEVTNPNTPAVILDPVVEDDPPAEVAPVTPPEAPPAITAPTPVPAAVEQKVKIGDKEFTAEQIAAQMKELEDFRARSAAPEIVPQEEPAPTPAPAPTAEEIAKRESDFIKTTMEALDAPLTEKEIDTLLAGGAEAVTLLQTMRRQDMARAILEARKGVAAGLNPIMQNLFDELKPLVGHHQQLRQQLVEQHFVAKHKDFVPFVDKARAVASELWRRYPDQVARMSADQFVDEVARQTGTILDREWKSFHPADSVSWRDAGKAATPPPAEVAPVAAAPAPVTPPPPAAPKKAAVKPPTANPPGGASNVAPASWQRGVASSLR